MSLKVHVEIPAGDCTAYCKVEVPLDSIGATTGGRFHKATQKYITDFTSATVTSVLEATREHVPNSSTAASSSNTDGKEKMGSVVMTPTVTASDGSDTNLKKRKRSEVASDLDEIFPLTDFGNSIRIKLRDTNDAEMYFSIGTRQPLHYALLVFAGHIGVPVTVLRFILDGARIDETSTAEDMAVEDGETFEVFRQIIAS